MAIDARPLSGEKFSTVWKKSFHGVEKNGRFFHTMEKRFAGFTSNGKMFPPARKTEERRPWTT